MIESITRKDWIAEGRRRFGDDQRRWRFVCPSCSHVAMPLDWINAGAPETAIAFSCVGRWAGANGEAFGKKGRPCNYAGGGLFRLNPVRVVYDDEEEHQVFAFAEDDAPAEGAAE